MRQPNFDRPRPTKTHQRLHLLACLLCALAACAGHAQPRNSGGGTPASTAPRELSGSIIGLSWADPIVELNLLADDGSVWQVRIASLGTLQALGIGSQALGIGTPLKVAGRMLPGSGHVLNATNLLLTPAREVVLESGARRRWIGAPP